MIIAFNDKGDIVASIPNNQNVETFFYHYPDEFKKNIKELCVEKVPNDLKNYRVIDGELVRMTDAEISEIQIYGKILTEEERQLNKLKPSYAEVQKAENTIEILTLLQEVM